MPTRLSSDEALDLTRTGDIWLFRGRTGADRAIQTMTNSPVNHVGMAVVLDDLPPLLWHAELGRSLPDLWAGEHRRGAQLHDLRAALGVWTGRYHQRAWLRQLEPPTGRDAEDAVLRTIARMDGTPFPRTAALAGRYAGGQVRALAQRARELVPHAARGGPDHASDHASDPAADTSRDRLESAFCAEIVAMTYQEMGLLPADRSPSWYDPGRFWSGDHLDLVGARLGDEIAVDP